MSTYAFGAPMGTPSAAAASSLVLRAVPGRVDIIQVNTAGSPGFVMLHNLAAAPVDGAVTPVMVWQIGANATLTVGAVLTFSTTGPTTQTLSATAWFNGRMA